MIQIVNDFPTLAPVFNDVKATLVSDNSNQENFFFIAEIYVGSEIVSSLRFPVNPKGFGVVNINKHLQSIMGSDFDPSLDSYSGTKTQTKSFVEYDVAFFEEFRPTWAFQSKAQRSIGQTLIFSGSEDPTAYLQVGDQIVITQDFGYTNAAINGLATIVSITYSALKWHIEINKLVTSALDGAGGVIKLSNFRTVKSDVLALSTFKKVFRGVRNYNDARLFNYLEYTAGYNGGGEFLTTVPRLIGEYEPSFLPQKNTSKLAYKLRPDSYMYLSLYGMKSAVSENVMLIIVLDIAPDIDIRFAVPLNRVDMQLVGVSPKLLNEIRVKYLISPISGLVVLDPDNPNIKIIPDFVKAYHFYIDDYTSPTFATDVWWKGTSVFIDTECRNFEDIQFIYLDKLGSYIPMHFYLKNREFREVNRKTYIRANGIDTDENGSTYRQSYDRGKTVFDAYANNLIQVTTDWLSDLRSKQVIEMLESPEIYMVRDNIIYSVVYEEQSNEVKQTINDQVINYTLTFRLSQNDRLQSF